MRVGTAEVREGEECLKIGHVMKMDNKQRVLKYFTHFEKNFPNIVYLFKSRNVQKVISNLIDNDLLTSKRDYDLTALNPFDKLLLEYLLNKDAILVQILINLENALNELLPGMKNKMEFISVYKSLCNTPQREEKQFFERCNELDVLKWINEIGEIEGLEVNPNNINTKKGIDFEANISGAKVYGEIMSFSELGYRKTHEKLKKDLCRIVNENFDSQYYTDISFNFDKELNVGEYANYLKGFKKFLDSDNSISFDGRTNKEYILKEIERKGACGFPYPTGTHNYDFMIYISNKKDFVEVIMSPNYERLINRIKRKVYKKLYDDKNGKLILFAEGEINLMVFFISHQNDLAWKFRCSGKFDEYFFQKLRIEIEEVLDPKISGHIIRTVYYDSNNDILKHYTRIFLNPCAIQTIPKLVYDAFNNKSKHKKWE